MPIILHLQLMLSLSSSLCRENRYFYCQFFHINQLLCIYLFFPPFFFSFLFFPLHVILPTFLSPTSPSHSLRYPLSQCQLFKLSTFLLCLHVLLISSLSPFFPCNPQSWHILPFSPHNFSSILTSHFTFLFTPLFPFISRSPKSVHFSLSPHSLPFKRALGTCFFHS